MPGNYERRGLGVRRPSRDKPTLRVARNSEWKEFREREHKAVVRIFLFQAKAPEMIPDDTDLTKVRFMDTLLIRKGAGPSENQLMPIGGKVDDGEDIHQAVRREALEETHLRPIPSTLRPFEHVQNYQFRHQTDRHSKPTTKQRRAYFFAANLLPTPHDVPYVLDQAEDKIQNFERLDYNQLVELLDTGTITTPAGPATILDSLDQHAERRLAQGTEIHQDEVEDMHAELLTNFGLREAEKKLNVLMVLTGSSYSIKLETDSETLHKLHAMVRERLYAESTGPKELAPLTSADLLMQIDHLWGQAVAEHPQWTVDHVRRALATVNMRETLQNAVEHYDFERGVGIPTVNLIFPLLATGKLEMAQYRVLQENQQAKQLLQVTQILYHYQHLQTDLAPNERLVAEARVRRKLGIDSDTPINLDAIRQWMQRQDMMNEEIATDYDDLAEGIDRYFEVLHREAHISDFSIDQVNEVKGIPFEELVTLAFGADHARAQREPAFQRRVEWEAQRKLLLLLIVHEATAYRKEILRRGIQPLNKLEQALELPGSKVDERVLQLAGQEQPVLIDRRQKTLMSFVRKIIVRDRMSAAVGDDTFAEAIIFTGQQANFEEVPYSLTDKVTTADEQPVTEIQLPRVVVDYIETLLAKAAERNDTIRIEKLKGLPKPGESYASSGAGGGAPVRMVKFYVEHIDATGVVRQREVQLFVPNVVEGVWQSGEVDYENKKQDDADYALRRLFSTKALRSFIELLYPAEVYGDMMQPIYSARVSSTVS